MCDIETSSMALYWRPKNGSDCSKPYRKTSSELWLKSQNISSSHNITQSIVRYYDVIWNQHSVFNDRYKSDPLCHVLEANGIMEVTECRPLKSLAYRLNAFLSDPWAEMKFPLTYPNFELSKNIQGLERSKWHNPFSINIKLLSDDKNAH